MPRRNTPPQFASAGSQRISLSNSTALGLNSTCQAGRWFHISVETNKVRYLATGSSPTLTTGVLLDTGDHFLPDVPGASLKFQRSTGTCVLNVMALKYLGE